MLAREHAHPKAAMRAAELLLQQGKTDAAMTQLAAIKSVKGEQGNRAKACWCRHTSIKNNMLRRWCWPRAATAEQLARQGDQLGQLHSGPD
jgi:hypothetical protein